MARIGMVAVRGLSARVSRTTQGDDQIGTAANNRASDLFGAVVPTKDRIPLDDEVFAFDIAEPVQLLKVCLGSLRWSIAPVSGSGGPSRCVWGPATQH